MAGYGIIGEGDASEDVITASLDDFLESLEKDEGYWYVIGVPESPTEAHSFILSWMLEHDSYFELVLHPDLELDDSVTNAAAKTTKAANVHDRVVAATVKDGGTHLLVLVGEDQPSDAVMTAIEKGRDEGLDCRDLSQAGCDVIDLTAPTGDSSGDDDEIDWAAAGPQADDGDDDCITALNEKAGELGLDPDSFPTWAGLADAIVEKLAAAKKPAATAKKASGATKKAAATSAPANDDVPETPEGGWTEEALADFDIKQLKAIAKAAGIEVTPKMGRPQVAKLLLAGGDETVASKPGAAAKKGGAATKAAPKQSGDGDSMTLLADALDAFASTVSALAGVIRAEA